MNIWATALFGLLGSAGFLAGLVSLLTLRATRRRIVAESTQFHAKADETVASAARVFIGGAVDLVAPLRRQLGEAEKAATAATVRANLINRKLEHTEGRVTRLESKLDRLRSWIHDPYMTIEQLRARVPAPTGTNGTAAQPPS
jgi:hypothetical protein